MVRSAAPRCLRSHTLKPATRHGSSCCNAAAAGWQTPISTRHRANSLAPKMVWWLRRPPIARGHRHMRRCSLNTTSSSRSAVSLAEPRHGRGALPLANIARLCRRYSPAARARPRNRQDMVRLARSADVPAASMPRSRSPTCLSPFVTGHRWPSRRRHRSARLWRQKPLQFTKKSPFWHASSPLPDPPIRQLMGNAH